MRKKELKNFHEAYIKYAEPDWDYVEPTDENYDMIIKNRSAYIFREMIRKGEVQPSDIEAIEKINATVEMLNQQRCVEMVNIQELLKKTESGDASAMSELSRMYIDNREALIREADAGNLKAQVALSELAWDAGDDKDALFWMEKAANEGHLSSQFNLANCYVEGDRVPLNHKLANYWYEKAAKQGHISSQFNLAMNYCYGECGMSVNPERAFYWFDKAAAQDDIEAIIALGNCYRDGIGTTQSYHTALNLYKQASDAGHIVAKRKLGECYYNGEGVPVDENKAFQLLREAADQGDEVAVNHLRSIQVSISPEGSYSLNDNIHTPNASKKRIQAIAKFVAVAFVGVIILGYLLNDKIDSEGGSSDIKVAYSALYDILKATVDEHGIADNSAETDSMWGYKVGLGYAELIDFDINGIPELLYIYYVGEMDANQYSVYGYSETGETELLSEGIMYDSTLLEIAVNQSTGWRYLCEHTIGYAGAVESGGMMADTQTYYTIRDGKWAEALSRRYEERYPGDGTTELTFQINGDEVNEDEYNNAKETEIGITEQYEIIITDFTTIQAVLDELKAKSDM